MTDIEQVNTQQQTPLSPNSSWENDMTHEVHGDHFHDLSMQQQLSLAAIMLLAPVIPASIRNNEITLSPEENEFVTWYIRYGYYVLWALWVSALFRLIDTFIKTHTLLNIISQGASIIAIIMIFIGMYAIIHNTSLIQNNRFAFKTLLSLFKHTK